MCSARWAIEAGLNDACARRAVLAAAQLPQATGPLVIRYAGLFRRPDCALDWVQAAQIIERIGALIARGEIRRAQACARAPVAVWREALEQMLTRRAGLDLPLTGDGYLTSVVFALAAARDEREHHGVAQERTSSSAAERSDAAGMQRLDDLLKREGIGASE